MNAVLISLLVAGGMLFANIYTSVVDASSWGSDIPNSIAVAREYFKEVNPGNFFRIFSPANQLFGLLALIICWKTNVSVRWYLAAAFILYAVAEGMTFQYFYPRNAILFRSAAITDVALLKKTWTEWNSMNWVRSAVLLVGIVFSAMALHKIASLYPRVGT